MEMKYTNTSAEIVFLKDADIIQDFNLTTISGNEVSVNGIPSYTFFKLRNDSIVMSADNLCIDIKLSVNTLLSGDITYTGSNTYAKELSAANISALNGNIANLTANNIAMTNVGISDLITTNEIVTNLTATRLSVSSADLSVVGISSLVVSELSAKDVELVTTSISDLTATTAAITTETVTTLTVADKVTATVISASVLSIVNDDIMPEGGYTHLSIDGTGVYIDLSSSNEHINDRKVKLQLPHDISDIEINNKSLSSYMHDEAELCSNSCKQFTTDSINALDKTTLIANGKIISCIIETDGLVSAEVRDLLQSDVSNLTADLANISADYVKHAGDEIAYLSVKTDLSTKNLYVTNNRFDPALDKTFKSNVSADENGIVLELNGDTRKLCVNYDSVINGIDGIVVNSKTLTEHVHDKISVDFTKFEYSRDRHSLEVTLAGKVLSVDTTDFIKNRVVKAVEILTLYDPIEKIDKKYLIIWFSDKKEPISEATEGIDYVKIDILSLTQVYKFSNGVSSDGYLNVEVDSTIPRLSALSANDVFADATRKGYTISSLSESNGVISYGICRLTSADVENLEGFVKDSISANYNKVSAEISAVSSDLQKQIVSNDNDIKYLSSELSSEIVRNLDSMHLVKNLSVNVGDKSLTAFLNHNFESDAKYLFKKGHMFRFDSTLALLSDYTEAEHEFEKNDYLIVETPHVLSDMALSDFRYINDYDEEIARDYKTLSDAITSNWQLISDLSGELSTISGNLCVEISGLSNEVSSISNSLCLEISALSIQLDEISGNLCAEVSSLSNQVSSISSNLCVEVSNLSDQVAFISAGLSSDLSIAQNDISTKIWIKDSTAAAIDTKYRTGTYSDLSIIKLNIEDYKNIIVNNPTLLSDDKLYVVDSDYIEAYGQVISNLTMTNDRCASEATNKHYVDTTINAISTDLKNQITSNDSDINYLSGVVENNISATLKSLSTDYSYTLSAIDKNAGYGHISSDNLVIADVNGAVIDGKFKQRYYLTFLSGTMVLKKM